MTSIPLGEPVSKATVLLVDDNAAFRELTEMALSSLGYAIEPCSSPAVALEHATRSSRFDVLITDVVMATMNGVQLADEVRRVCPGIKVLFCSGYPAAALARQGLDLSAGEFLMKPISLASLASKIVLMLTPPEVAA